MDETILQHTVFRLLMRGMSRPGTIISLPSLPQDEPAVVYLLACILDNEVNFSVLDNHNISQRLTRFTGSQQTQTEDADYIIICNGDSRNTITSCQKGTLEYPDSGVTLIYLVDQLINTPGHLSLSGPGIRNRQQIEIKGISSEEIAKLTKINREFPLGVDAVFLDKTGKLACIPRSTRIEVH